MPLLSDRTKQTTTSTGTGSLALTGTVAGFRPFADAHASGSQLYYGVTDGTAWEVGLGTFTAGSPGSLARNEVSASSNGNALVNWGVGTKEVFVTLPASLALAMQPMAVKVGGTTIVAAATTLNFTGGGATVTDGGGGVANVTVAIPAYGDPVAFTAGSGNGGSFTNGNRTAVSNGNGYWWTGIVGGVPLVAATGSYFEMSVDSMPGANNSPAIALHVSGFGERFSYVANGVINVNGSQVSTVTTYTNGNVIGLARKGSKVWVAKNGVWLNSGDPANDANPISSAVTTDTLYAAVTVGNGNVATIISGQNCHYPPPIGFTAIHA